MKTNEILDSLNNIDEEKGKLAATALIYIAKGLYQIANEIASKNNKLKGKY